MCFDASDNLKRSHWGYWVSRRALEVARTIPDLVYALIFVLAFGIGPLAGILAIAVHSMGGNGKLFAEAVENVDPRPLNGLRAAGASWLQTIRYAVLPQVLPTSPASRSGGSRSTCARRASSVSSAPAASAFVCRTATRTLHWDEASFILLLILASVCPIDMLSKRIRLRPIRGVPVQG